MMSEARGNMIYENNCIYIPECYRKECRKRLESGEVVSYEEDGEQSGKWLEMDGDEYMVDYEVSYKKYLAWLTPCELLQEYKIMRFPWRYRERKWIKEEIESRCVY